MDLEIDRSALAQKAPLTTTKKAIYAIEPRIVNLTGQGPPRIPEDEKKLFEELRWSALSDRDAHFLRACTEGNADDAKGWLSLGADLNARLGPRMDGTAGEGALELSMAATGSGCAHWLMDLGLDPLGPDGDGAPFKGGMVLAFTRNFTSKMDPGSEEEVETWSHCEAVCSRGGATPSQLASLTTKAVCFSMLSAARMCFGATGINKIADDGLTPLGLAVESGNNRMIVELVKLGANVDATDTLGLTALIRAAARSKFDCIDALGDAGADFSKTSSTGGTAADYALYAGYDELATKLDAEAIHQASFGSDWISKRPPIQVGAETLKSWGYDPASPNAVNTAFLPPWDQSLDAAFLRSCAAGDSQAVLDLISQGADINATDALFNSALILAVASGSQPCCAILLDSGAKLFNSHWTKIDDRVLAPYHLDSRLVDRSPLNEAMGLGRLDLVEMILSSKQARRDGDSVDKAALGIIAWRTMPSPQSLEAMELLCRYGATPLVNPSQGADGTDWVKSIARDNAQPLSSFDSQEKLESTRTMLDRAVELAGGPAKSGLNGFHLAQLARAGHETFAYEWAEKLYADGVDFNAQQGRGTNHSFIEDARASGWESGAAWMAEVRLARMEKEMLASEFGAAAAPKRRRMSL